MQSSVVYIRIYPLALLVKPQRALGDSGRLVSATQSASAIEATTNIKFIRDKWGIVMRFGAYNKAANGDIGTDWAKKVNGSGKPMAETP